MKHEELLDRVADTLAYYQCRETNPKADDPITGYRTFSEDQRQHLRDQKREAAEEIIRLFKNLIEEESEIYRAALKAAKGVRR